MGNFKICPKCGTQNNPSFSHCHNCKQDLLRPATEQEIRELYAKQGLPMGIIVFIIFGIWGIVSQIQQAVVDPKAYLTNYSLIAIDIFLILVIVGLIKSREWGRKAAIIYEVVALLNFFVVTLIGKQIQNMNALIALWSVSSIMGIFWIYYFAVRSRRYFQYKNMSTQTT